MVQVISLLDTCLVLVIGHLSYKALLLMNMLRQWNMVAIHILPNFAPFSGPNCKRHLLVAIAICTRLLAPKKWCPVPNSKRRLTHNIRNSANHHQVFFHWCTLYARLMLAHAASEQKREGRRNWLTVQLIMSEWWTDGAAQPQQHVIYDSRFGCCQWLW